MSEHEHTFFEDIPPYVECACGKRGRTEFDENGEEVIVLQD